MQKVKRRRAEERREGEKRRGKFVEKIEIGVREGFQGGNSQRKSGFRRRMEIK